VKRWTARTLIRGAVEEAATGRVRKVNAASA
jgi:hypothetical protein